MKTRILAGVGFSLWIATSILWHFGEVQIRESYDESLKTARETVRLDNEIQANYWNQILSLQQTAHDLAVENIKVRGSAKQMATAYLEEHDDYDKLWKSFQQMNDNYTKYSVKVQQDVDFLSSQNAALQAAAAYQPSKTIYVQTPSVLAPPPPPTITSGMVIHADGTMDDISLESY